MAEIFVSYSRKDKEQVQQILRDLSGLGYEYWMDSQKIQGGELWTQEIPEAIEACKVFLFFMSADSILSDNVRREIQLAFEKQRKIVILRFDRSEIPLPLQYALAGIQWIDYSESDWRSRLSIALKTGPTTPKLKDWGQETKTTRSNDEIERVRRFEGAMPGTANLDEETEVRVMISLPNSKGLRAHLPQTADVPGELTRRDVKRSDVPLSFPRDPATNEPLDLDLWIVITANGFDLQQPAKKIRVPAKSDSGVFSFSLTPRVASQRAIVTLELRERKNGPTLGTLTLTTEVKLLQGEITQALWILTSLLMTSATVTPEQAVAENVAKEYRPAAEPIPTNAEPEEAKKPAYFPPSAPVPAQTLKKEKPEHLPSSRPVPAPAPKKARSFSTPIVLVASIVLIFLLLACGAFLFYLLRG